MLKLSLWRLMATFLMALVVTACGGGNGGPAAAPTDFKVTPGNGQVTLTWTAQPGVDYWVMYAPTATPIDIKNPPSNHAWLTNNITSPYVLNGLTNGVTYSFAMNARTGGGKGGEQTASQSVVPRYAGSTWVAGTSSLGNSDMRGVAYGTASDSTVNYLAVGSGGAIYKGLEGVIQGLTGMVWTALAPSPSIATDFRAATYAFGKYIALGANTGVKNIVSSTDLSTWTAATWTPPVAPAGAGLNAIANNGTILLAVGDGGNAFSTADGVTWTAVTTGVATNLYGVAYSSTVGWVIVGAGGTLITSTDLVNWHIPTSGAVGIDLNGVAITSGNVLVAVGTGGVVIKSTDGTNWLTQTLAASNLFAVSTDSAQFLAVGTAGAVFTSTDGATWTSVSQTSATTDLMAIAGSTSKYMVVGKAGANMSSTH